MTLLLLVGTLFTAGPCDAWNPVHGDPGLHCIELVPRPEFEAASGSVRLVPARSPFGVAVTRDGVPLLDLVVRLDGLPGGKHFAWASGPSLSPLIPLGEVANGETALGAISLERFTIFITRVDSALVPSTSSPSSGAPPGTIVLRGMSPSSVLLPHITVPARAQPHAHAGGWEMPAPHPSAPIMTPGLEVLVPAATAWLPGKGIERRSLPPVKPRSLVRLADGDTLALEAGMVRRHVAGRSFVAYAFNGESPGPLLQVERGARVTVVLVNRLDQPTTVHWHGIRLDHRFDGAAGVSQEAVAPGGRFTYELVFPDAGIFWYHPHVREDIQQELGLYGNILVRGADSALMGRVHREEVLILDDMLLGADGPIAFGEAHATHALMGRFGNVFLVNGEPIWRVDARPGEVVRLYFTNAANARTFNLSLDGARMKLVAGDMGRVAEERWVESVVIGAAERWVVDVRFDSAGTYVLTNRVRGVEPRARAFLQVVDTLGVVTVQGRAARPDHSRDFAILRKHADLAAQFTALDSLGAREPDRTLVLALRTGELPFGLVQALRVDTAWVMPVEWAGLMPMMDWLATGKDVTWVLRDSATGRENMAVDWRFRRGDRILLRLVNERRSLHPMHHPMHLHGQRFAVVARNGRRVRDHVWKDTVIVPAGGTVDLLVEFDNPGRWMLHCHVAEHLETGMHLVMTVE